MGIATQLVNGSVIESDVLIFNSVTDSTKLNKWPYTSNKAGVIGIWKPVKEGPEGESWEGVRGCGGGKGLFRQFELTEMGEMFKKKQIEVIDFREFMAGTYGKPNRLNTSVLSFMPSITLSSFLSPDVAGIYAVVFGVFAIGMLSHFLETYAASSGREELAWAIETVTRLAFTIGGFSSIAWFLLSL